MQLTQAMQEKQASK